LVEHAPCKDAVGVETPSLQEAGIQDRNKPAEKQKKQKKTKKQRSKKAEKE
jgi:hypothetical protein